jgi:ferredoxin-type protein NapG
MGDGAPYIEASEMPCVLCDGLKCMHVCPTGALVPTILDQVDMGTAFWNESICVRSHGENCTICIDHCPIGTAALELLEGKVKVHEEGCSGCGVCQHRCPTDPKSIIVIPKAARR